MNLNHFSRFEQMAQQLFEGSFGRFFGSQLLPADIAARLASVLEADLAAGRHVGKFQVSLNPADLELLHSASPELENQLADYLVALAARAESPLSERPEVELIAEEVVKRKQVVIASAPRPRDKEKMAEETRTHAPDRQSLSLRKLEETDAFVVVDGKRHVPLGRPLITVGRQLDNDIVLDAPSVSRQHAQLRWRYGRFVLYDLGSQYGTTVNGHPVTEHVLQAGDVIRLSTVSMVYGEDPVERNGSRSIWDGVGSADDRPEGDGMTQPFDPGDGS